MRGNFLKRPRDPAQLAKLMIDIASGEVEDRAPAPDDTGKNAAAVALGPSWRQRRAAMPGPLKLSAKKRKEIAQMGAAARWANKAEKDGI